MESDGIYWFFKGFNWHALAAWTMGVWITLLGFAQWVRSSDVTLQGWSQMYYFSWPLGTVLSMGTYIALCWLRPVGGVGVVDMEEFPEGAGRESQSVIEGIEGGKDKGARPTSADWEKAFVSIAS